MDLSFAAASRGDPSVVGDHVSMDPGTRVVGSDPAEWLRGRNADRDTSIAEPDDEVGWTYT